jgi:LysR family glycine cleavage system transcriptional activator
VFPDWPRWLAAAGLRLDFATPGLHVNSTATVIQCALNGQGIALVRHALVAHDLAEGRLQRCLEGHAVPFAWSYYGLVAHGARDVPAVKRFAAWLTDHWQSQYGPAGPGGPLP